MNKNTTKPLQNTLTLQVNRKKRIVTQITAIKIYVIHNQSGLTNTKFSIMYANELPAFKQP